MTEPSITVIPLEHDAFRFALNLDAEGVHYSLFITRQDVRDVHHAACYMLNGEPEVVVPTERGHRITLTAQTNGYTVSVSAKSGSAFVWTAWDVDLLAVREQCQRLSHSWIHEPATLTTADVEWLS